MVGGAILAWLGWRQYLKTTLGRLRWDHQIAFTHRGDLVEKGARAGQRSLAPGIPGGVPVVQGLSLSAQVIDNAHISQALVVMRSQIERGDSLLTASAQRLSPLVLQMIMVGEGLPLGEMLEEIGQMYQRDMEYGLKGPVAEDQSRSCWCLMGPWCWYGPGRVPAMWDLEQTAIK